MKRLATYVAGILSMGFLSGCVQSVEKFFISLEERPQVPKIRDHHVKEVQFKGVDTYRL